MKYIFYSSLLSVILTYSAAARCGRNEFYYLCQPCAALNCFESPPFFCSEVCQNPGCYCKPGYLRKNGVCVPEQYCYSDAICGPNEHYSQCQPCAALNCGDTKPEACIAVCRNPGCYCQSGYLRKNGVCVPEQFCSSANCGPNESYYECQPCTPLACGDLQPICTEICHNPGCYCKSGFLKKNGTCVPENSCCDAICGQNEVYRECQPCAAINCGDTPPEVCIDICQNPGCYCESGFLRKNGVCVPEALCFSYA